MLDEYYVQVSETGNARFTDIVEEMKIKYSLSSIVIATFTLWIFLHYWPSESVRNGQETSAIEKRLLTKYQFLRLKQSGKAIV